MLDRLTIICPGCHLRAPVRAAPAPDGNLTLNFAEHQIRRQRCSRSGQNIGHLRAPAPGPRLRLHAYVYEEQGTWRADSMEAFPLFGQGTDGAAAVRDLAGELQRQVGPQVELCPAPQTLWTAARQGLPFLSLPLELSGVPGALIAVRAP